MRLLLLQTVHTQAAQKPLVPRLIRPKSYNALRCSGRGAGVSLTVAVGGFGCTERDAMMLRFLPVHMRYDQFTRAVHVVALNGDSTLDVQISRAAIEHLVGITLLNKDDSFPAIVRHKRVLEHAAETALASHGTGSTELAIKTADVELAQRRVAADALRDTAPHR